MTFCARASKEFSISSLMTEAGRSTTSPAAIRSATCGDSMLISDMEEVLSWKGDDKINQISVPFQGEKSAAV